nr:hypothetical protein [uncultured Prevotella sp.]
MEDYLTEIERKRADERKRICKEYQELAPEMIKAGCKPWRVIRKLAKKHHKTTGGIAWILRKERVYQGAADALERYKI